MLAVGSNFEMSNVNTFSDYKSNFKSTKRMNNINNLLRAAVSNFENVAPGGGGGGYFGVKRIGMTVGNPRKLP